MLAPDFHLMLSIIENVHMWSAGLGLQLKKNRSFSMLVNTGAASPEPPWPPIGNGGRVSDHSLMLSVDAARVVLMLMRERRRNIRLAEIFRSVLEEYILFVCRRTTITDEVFRWHGQCRDSVAVVSGVPRRSF